MTAIMISCPYGRRHVTQLNDGRWHICQMHPGDGERLPPEFELSCDTREAAEAQVAEARRQSGRGVNVARREGKGRWMLEHTPPEGGKQARMGPYPTQAGAVLTGQLLAGRAR